MPFSANKTIESLFKLTDMLYYTEKTHRPDWITNNYKIYLEKLPAAFVFFPKNAMKFTSSKQQNILSLFL